MSDLRRRYEHGRPRGMRPWRPSPTTRPVLDHVLAALDDFAGYLPVTNRQILYRLIGAYGDSKRDEDRIERVDRGHGTG